MTDVTIVIPTRERPEFLRATLHSILASAAEAGRSGTRTRILVVDDASPTDSTERLAAELDVDYHRIAVHDGRNNPAAAIAIGVGLVESPYYSLFGDDDIMLPRFIGAHVAALAEGYDVCSTSFIQTDADLKPVREVILPEATLGDLLAGKVTINDGAMTRTELTRDLAWDPSLDQVILYPIWLELLFRGSRFVRLTEPSFLYRRHDGNVSDRLGGQDAAQRDRVRQHFRNRVIARDGTVPGPSSAPLPADARSGPSGASPKRPRLLWRRVARRLRSLRPRPASAPPHVGTPAAMPYDPIEYWTRLHERNDFSAVGQSGLPDELNRWLYRALRRNVRAFLSSHGLTRPFPERAFDVGAGLGFWAQTWHELGATIVDGCDLVPAAVDRLNARLGPGGEFVVADITRADQMPSRRYPFVSCLNVLLHVTDPAAFDAALLGIAGLVEPGGVLLLAEPIVAGTTVLPPYDRERHSRARHLDDYRGPLEAAGLEMVALAAATVLANNPIEGSSPAAYRRYVRWWKFVAGRTKRNPKSSRWIGPLVDTADRFAIRTGAAPSTKLVLFRRPTR